MVQEAGVQPQVESFQKKDLRFLYLTLGIIRYGSRVSVAVHGKELNLHLHLDVVAIQKGVFSSRP